MGKSSRILCKGNNNGKVIKHESDRYVWQRLKSSTKKLGKDFTYNTLEIYQGKMVGN